MKRWPGLWTDGRGGPPPRGLLQQIPGNTGWAPDTAHQPDLSYIPYLLTGRRAFLDELVAVAMWNIAGTWPAVRNPPGWDGPGKDMILGHRWLQVRSVAWALRQIDSAAWIMPDDDPDAGYLREASAGNWAWLRAQIPAWTAMQGEAHGWLPGEYGTKNALPPWQQDYLSTTVAAAARRGNADARAFLRWMANFLVGRFRAESKGFPFNDGAAYLLAIAPDGGSQWQPFRTWSEIGEAMRAHGVSNGDGWARSEGDYIRLAMQGLAMVIDVLDLPEAHEAYARLVALRPPRARPADFARNPSQNIVPRGMQRIASRIRACTPAAPLRG